MPAQRDDLDDDPYLALEEVDGAEAAAWVSLRNAEALARLATGERPDELRGSIKRILDADDRIPVPYWHDGRLYNLWRDGANPRGLWRRTTLDEYRKPETAWETVLDVDALAAAEGESWVWHGAAMAPPGVDRCLVWLSRGGSDAAVVREFDLAARDFVSGGFTLPEAKSRAAWIDADHVYVSTGLGPGSLTSSGYPRLVKQWRRGTPLAQAETVFACDPDDVLAYGHHDATPGYERDFVVRRLDFFRTERHLRPPSGELIRLEVPEDAGVGTHREWLLITPRSPWTPGAVGYPAGALLAIRLDDFLAGDRALTVLFEPTADTALSYYSTTREHLILSLLTDVRSRLELRTPGPDGWRHSTLHDGTGFNHTEVVATDPWRGDEYLLTSSGYTQPATLWYGRVGEPSEIVKQEPSFFDATGITVRQLFAVSADGTRVPYFVVGAEQSGPTPTLLTGYGGFEDSNTPYYRPVIGHGWLARGGTLVVANIRGGGEYGPSWHRAALRENRPRAYEDFAAVAADLVTRGVTTPGQLGVEGGSNGGLLTGVMLTRYPELFGAVVSRMPLLDMLRYHRLLAGASWIAEYGDPDDPADRAYLRGFSPYHNVHDGRTYPPALLVTSTRDDRVHPGHARKMAALLRERGHDVTYYENVEGGHEGAADSTQSAFHWAVVLEFLWQRLT